MKKSILLLFLLMFLVQGGFAWGKKSSGSAPAAVSNATTKAEKKAEQAKQAADSAKQHAQTALANMNSGKIEYEVKMTQAETAKAAAAAATAKLKAADAVAAAQKSGTPEAAAAVERARRAAEEASAAAAEAERLNQEVEKEYAKYKSRIAEYEQAVNDQNSKDALSAAAQEYLRAAEKADKEYTEAWEKYKAAKKDLDAAIDQLEKDREEKTAEEYKKTIDDFYKKEQIAQQYYKEAEIKANATVAAYEKVGDYYKEIGICGDPVFVGTGDYVAEYEDFVAQNNIDKFVVKRSLKSDGKNESFGCNWTCSLDTRIVRCNFKDWTEKKDLIEKCIRLSADMKSYFVEYDSRNPNFPREESKTYLTYSENMNDFMNKELVDVRSIIETRNYLLERNKYCTYGRFSNPDSYYGYSKQLIFLDEDGNENYFLYEGNGLWESAGIINKSKIKIYFLDESKNRSNSASSDGGYEVVYDNGNRSFYDKYGILTKKIDRNGNERLFFNVNGLINEIVLETGEHIYVNRNGNGYITKIEGNVSGTTTYSYSDNKLCEVTDNNLVKVKYSYWENLLQEIIKADKKSVKLSYEYNSGLKKYVCSKVINENGVSEEFSFDTEHRTVTHRTTDGKTEYYELNKFGNPVYVKDKYLNETRIYTDDYSLITSVIKNGQKKNFSYDENYRPCQITYSNGGVARINYESGDYVSEIIDADGFSRKLIYDEKKNIIEERLNNILVNEFEYYQSGLLKKSKTGNSSVAFEYNKYGSIIKRVETDETGNVITWEIEYDHKNRPVTFIDAEGLMSHIFYDDFYKKEESLKTEKELFFDGRKRVEKIISRDLITGQKIEKKYIYESGNNIKEVYVNENKYISNEYSESGELAGKTIWNLTDENGVLGKQGIKNEKVLDDKGFLILDKKTPVCDIEDNKRYLIDDRVFYSELKYDFTSETTDVNARNPLGLTSKSTYDPYGRLIKEEFPSGYIRRTSYTKAGRKSYITDSDFMKWEYKYKSDGSYNIYVSKKNENVSVLEYDRSGRLIYSDEGVGNRCYYTYKNNKLIEEKTPFYIRRCEYDKYGRKQHFYIKYINGNSTGFKRTHPDMYKEYHISYDDTNYSVKVYLTNPEEYFIKYKYSGFGNPIEIEDKNGFSHYVYDDLGRVHKKIDGNGNVFTFYYDPNNLVCCVLYPDGKYRFINHTVDGACTKIIDSDHVLKKVDYENLANKIVYTDCFDNKTTFYYDTDGLINNVCMSKSGSNDFGTLKEISLSAGIVKNEFGKIIEAKNDNSNLVFEYDLYERLTSVSDLITGISLVYEYDQFGRIIEERIDNNITTYEYSPCGYISKVINDDSYIAYEYDPYGRVVEKNYSDGLHERISYNDYGLMESKVISDGLGQLVECNVLLYDEKGRLKYSFNKDGQYNFYEYNNKGQVETVYYPYSEKLYEFYRDEASDCGSVYSRNPDKEIIFLPTETSSELMSIANKARIERVFSYSDYQECWKEKYLYTDSGSIESVKNNIGTIYYFYDNENHLIEKTWENSKNDMKLNWSDNGELANVRGVKTNINFLYGSNGRIEKIEYVDNDSLDSLKVCYKYDALGRRVRTSSSDGGSTLYFYKDFSSNVLISKPVFQNNILVSDSDLKLSDTDTVYRYTNDEKYSPFGTAQKGIDNTVFVRKMKNNDNESVPIEYDIYRNPHNQKYNFEDFIIDNGSRDYISILRTFTSEDPVHDGTNWYSYCSGDPVNYVDISGNEIIPVPSVYLMSDSVYKGMTVGNSNDKADEINKVGCYITCYANVMCELYGRGVVGADKVQYTSVIGVNNDKNLFSNEPGCGANLKRDDSMNAVFTDHNDYADVSWDYFTTEGSGSFRINIEMAKAKALQDDYIVMGVFDLSEKYENIPNHMVILNDDKNEDGIFEDITCSSVYDKKRQQENPDVYCEDNLKEIRVIKVENKKCTK